MKIFGYYCDVPDLNRQDELHLVHLWLRRWRAAGWDPWVLSEWDAAKHPYFAEFDRAISALPSVNPKPYERACYLRWLALAQVGGGFMADFDLIPYPPLKGFVQEPNIVLFQACAPSLVWAPKAKAEELCQRFAAGDLGVQNINGSIHHSDMYALEAIPDGDLVQRRDIVKGYGDPDWETAPLVHYSSGSMNPAGKVPKYRWIPKLRP